MNLEIPRKYFNAKLLDRGGNGERIKKLAIEIEREKGQVGKQRTQRGKLKGSFSGFSFRRYLILFISR